jgi:hypothetical protein
MQTELSAATLMYANNSEQSNKTSSRNNAPTATRGLLLGVSTAKDIPNADMQ